MPSPFRTSRTLLVALSASVVLGALTAGSARADDATVASLQVKLVEQRQQLNALYADSARAAEQLNGANLRLQRAKAKLASSQAAQRKAEAAFEKQRALVGALTVDQLQNGTPQQAMMSVLDGADPTQMLQEVSSLKAVDEAVTVRIDSLEASRTNLDASTAAVEQVVTDQKAATADRSSAQARIDASIQQAESLAASTKSQRDDLIKRLAAAQERPVAQVRAAQDRIDERLDSAGPSTPAAAQPEPSDPAPAPTTPKPTTPKPTTPPPADPPPASGSKVDRAIAFAKAQLGEPYEWAGAGPSSWDCSGLTMRAYQAAGISLSHYAPDQYTATKRVSVSNIQRGDLLYWSDGSASSIYHVALYLGGGQMIHAPRPGRGVEIVPVSYWIQPDLASRPA